jgi:hypothetical protein
MDKILIAQKCKGGWYVKIIETHCVDTETDVRKLMKAYNLKKVKEFSSGKRIYARLLTKSQRRRK